MLLMLSTLTVVRGSRGGAVWASVGLGPGVTAKDSAVLGVGAAGAGRHGGGLSTAGRGRHGARGRARHGAGAGAGARSGRAVLSDSAGGEGGEEGDGDERELHLECCILTTVATTTRKMKTGMSWWL